MDSVDLVDLIRRVRAGDQSATGDLVRRVEGPIRQFVRGRFPRALRSKFDSMDFVQSVWTSLLAEDGPDLDQFESSQHLMNFLAGMARNKVFQEHRRRTQTYKYDMKREEPLYVRRGDREFPRDVVGHDPTPSQDAQASDRLRQMLAGRPPLAQEVIVLRKSGLTFDEIAARLGIHEAAVRRIINGLRQHMEA